MDNAPENILIVEDDTALRDAIVAVLEHERFSVTAASSAEEALEIVRAHHFSCILSDFKLPQKNGIELLKDIRAIAPTVPFVIMTAYGSIEIAISAMKEGANDFITKPFEPRSLAEMLRQVITHRRIIDRNSGFRPHKERSLMGKSPLMDKLLKDARKVAKVDSSVLILGASGTGKELLARYIHEQSPRHAAPFVAVNCGAIPAELLESEFFGHEAGAFTGATQSRAGLFELAAHGTIFLDELAEMPLPLQVKLLRALQEHEIKRVGGTKTIKVTPRVLAATNRDIEKVLKSGELREDFYYRLAVITFTLPSLQKRKEDIDLLADYFVEAFSIPHRHCSPKLSTEARALLRSYPWPGNIRELENVIERAVILAEDSIEPEHLGLSLEPTFNALEDMKLSLTEIASQAASRAEREVITEVLKRTNGNKSKAAEMLGVSYKTLLNKVKEYHLSHRSEEAP